MLSCLITLHTITLMHKGLSNRLLCIPFIKFMVPHDVNRDYMYNDSTKNSV